ncbi:MAG: S9 family peptidase [Acidobacteria bacterium]|nr:S9 family peptidase [Acidobacteriota bacterium]
MSTARPFDRVAFGHESRSGERLGAGARPPTFAPALLVMAAAACLAVLPAAVGAQQRTLTIADIFDPARRVNFDGNAPFGLTWLDDTHYVERRSPRDAFAGPLVRVDALTGERTPLYDVAPFEAAVAALPGLSAADAGRIVRQSGHVTNPDRTALVFDFADDLYHYDVGTERARRLTATPEAEDEVSLSPDGRLVAFVRGGNLIVVDVEHRREHALTTDGGERVRNGQLDWVYQEVRGYWWSPDSSRIAYLQLDDRAVPTFTVLDHIPYHPEVEHWEYPKAGDTNPVVRLGIVRAAGGATTWADLSGYRPSDPLVVNVDWTPDSSHVVFQVQDREQTWLDLVLADPEGGSVEKVLRETTEAWVNVNGPPIWLEDGTFLWQSERSGWKHLYHVDRSGAVKRTVTSGEWEVRRVHGVDEEAGSVYFSATERSPIGLDVYRVNLDGSGLRRLSDAPGTHGATFSPGLTHYIDRWSDISTPPQVRVHAADGSVARVVAANEVRALRDYDLPAPEFLQVANRDGFEMEALLIRPPDFDPSRRYPVYQHIYGGPHVQRVRNAWSRETLYWQLLAQRGIVVWVLDNSTASGKGAVSTWPVYQRFGELELRDQEDGLDWLVGQGYVDADRIGIEGWSYGGFMVSYALTHSERWSMGIAGGSVTDWRDYDTIYTERYMRMPQHNPDGYRRSSPRFDAADLHGALLLVHGTMDENVHMQNTLQFALELQRAGKPFDMMIYPRSRHRLGGPDLELHRREKMLAFVLEHLRPEDVAGATDSSDE